ncbi:tyrosine-protein kinase HTK16-like [Mizuhopecten yessoensis]|uniref:Tyrosine-protein kinase n=1 Tax=Mizuhopecten yessoensis TaxID=6573 RepID=A0A210PW82_MIZYE|nr:tyrosine-protein kinase HTK16-like [Mizuhopecten yessoensis]OWF40712.1 Tyrosine-protein kinase HTK16 [Mizuhopecten yessoensis]
MSVSGDEYRNSDDEYDSVYANDAILDIANVSICLQKETLTSLLERDKKKTEKDDRCRWYHGKISREAAESLLKEGLMNLGGVDGLFLVRDSTSSKDDFVLSVTHNARVYQFQLKEVHDGHYRLDDGPTFPGLVKLIQYYQSPNKTGLVTTLTQHCQGSAPPPKARTQGPTNILHRAVIEGNVQIVKDILNHSLCPDVNAKSEWGTTALHDACKYGFQDIVQLLIEHKADVEMKDRAGLTPLHRSCATNRAEMIPILVEKGGANLQSSTPKTSWVPMHDAAMRGHVKCIKALLKMNAPLMPRAEDEQTPLDLAIKYNRDDCIKLLNAEDRRPIYTKQEDWLHPDLDRQQACQLLDAYHKTDGLFLVRKSRRNVNFHVITFCFKKNYYNFEVKVKDYRNKLVHYIDNGPLFPSLERVIDHYTHQSDGLTTKLTASVCPGQEELVYVRSENKSVERSHQVPKSMPRPNLPPRDEPEVPEDTYAEPANVSEPPQLPPSRNPPSATSKTVLSETKQQSVEEFKKVIDPKEIVLGQDLGEGEYGAVKKGKYTHREGRFSPKVKIDVAVKTFHQTDPAVGVNEGILREAILMQDLDHSSIVKLYGICENPFMLVEEFIPNGALCDYLEKHKGTNKIKVDPTLYLWASQIADGMQYLEQRNIVHRDLAARNILVESKHQVKISDFGLSRAYEEGQYYKASKGGRWPIKWYAPECVNYGKFTHHTDVWSYGITLWEMFSFADQPYGERKGIEVIQFVESGGRLECPKDCPPQVYEKMKKCWEKDPKRRPSFTELKTHFQTDPLYGDAIKYFRSQKDKKKN